MAFCRSQRAGQNPFFERIQLSPFILSIELPTSATLGPGVTAAMNDRSTVLAPFALVRKNNSSFTNFAFAACYLHTCILKSQQAAV